MILAAATLLLASSAGAVPQGPERLALARSISEARLSPEGREAAFVTDIGGAPEVWTAPLRGGWASPLTDLGGSARSLAYAPDGRRLAFAWDPGGSGRSKVYATRDDGSLEPVGSSSQACTSPAFSPDGRFLAFLQGGQLALLDLASGRTSVLTSESVALRSPVWSPDARLVAVARSGDGRKGELLIVDAASGEVRAIDPPVPGGLLIPEGFSADGRDLLCLARSPTGTLELYWLGLRDGTGRFLGKAGSSDVDLALLHPTAGLFFTRLDNGVSSLYRQRGLDAAPELLLQKSRGVVSSIDVDAAGERLLYVWGDSAHPDEAWLMDLRSGSTEKLSRSLPAGLRTESLSRAEPFSYRSFDGLTIGGLFLSPSSDRLGSPPPAVVVAHDGPDSRAEDRFDALRQALAEAGFAVILPNFRGSLGRGLAFLEANRRDWGGGDRRDLWEATRFLASKGRIDGRRVGLLGEGYGGTLALIAAAKSKGEWAAVVETGGAPDLAKSYGYNQERLGDWQAAQMGSPSADPALFADRSAVSALAKVAQVPLLIAHGALDPLLPRAEAESLYYALKERGAPAQYVLYLDDGRPLLRRRNRADFARRAVDFFSRRLAVASAP